ncbi:MAG: S41 family peptidase [Planctomycetota bacterium]|jgi:carboxyl-terminal processing protease
MKYRGRTALLLLPPVLLFFFLAGEGARARRGDRDALYRRGEILAEVTGLILERYVDPVDGEAVFHGALRGMLESLDDHCTLLAPEEAKRLEEEASGFYGGLAVTLVHRDDGLSLLAVEVGGPGWKGGLRPGDRILEIDGLPVQRLNVDRAAVRLRGDPGTGVHLMVKGALGENAREVTCVRERIPAVSVPDARRIDPAPGVGYVRVASFRRDTGLELREALAPLLEEGLEGLVLDLRNNPGGILEAAGAAADLFVREGLLVAVRGRTPEDCAEYNASAESTLAPFPMVVLVNGGTASAAEVLAGALQASGRATLVGSRTFGKRTIQSLVVLEDGWILKMTTGRFRFAGPASPDEGGLAPDVEVAEDSTEAAFLEAARAALEAQRK